jgi:solute carrier family 25 S-adenosylmethionine transporter 26
VNAANLIQVAKSSDQEGLFGASKDFKQLAANFKAAAAGGIAGAVTTFLLYPLDTIKTMRQSDPALSSSWEAVLKIAKTPASAYSGLVTAVLGSAPSSALYFGAYESTKRIYAASWEEKLPRPVIHMLAAASGNVISSIIFVPKEVIKSQIQAMTTGSIPVSATLSGSKAKVTLGAVFRDIYRSRGLKGFYPSYRATLARNIPSAVIRFTLYEELRRAVVERRKLRAKSQQIQQHTKGKEYEDWLFHLLILGSGAAASLFASAASTPLDVLKTRFSTGAIEPGTPIFTALTTIAREEGIHGLFAGMYSRAISSALFGGIGFAAFEISKDFLGLELSSET